MEEIKKLADNYFGDKYQLFSLIWKKGSCIPIILNWKVVEDLKNI